MEIQMTKRLHLDKNLELNACTTGHLLKIFFIRRIFVHFTNKNPLDQVAPRSSDLLLIFLVHRCFALFQVIDKSRSLLIKALNQLK